MSRPNRPNHARICGVCISRRRSRRALRKHRRFEQYVEPRCRACSRSSHVDELEERQMTAHLEHRAGSTIVLHMSLNSPLAVDRC